MWSLGCDTTFTHLSTRIFLFGPPFSPPTMEPKAMHLKTMMAYGNVISMIVVPDAHDIQGCNRTREDLSHEPLGV